MKMFKATLKQAPGGPLMCGGLMLLGDWCIDFDPPVPHGKSETSGIMADKAYCLDVAARAGIKPGEIKHDY